MDHMHYFTIEQREALQRQLLARGDELREEIAAADLETTAGRATHEHQLRELKYVAATLTRIHESDFGLCIDCGKDIAYARLSANPIATRCVGCQAQHERRRSESRAAQL